MPSLRTRPHQCRILKEVLHYYCKGLSLVSSIVSFRLVESLPPCSTQLPGFLLAFNPNTMDTRVHYYFAEVKPRPYYEFHFEPLRGNHSMLRSLALFCICAWQSFLSVIFVIWVRLKTYRLKTLYTLKKENNSVRFLKN